MLSDETKERVATVWGAIIFALMTTAILGAVNLLVTCLVDGIIVSAQGCVIMPQNPGQWTHLNLPSWTLSSLLGPLITFLGGPRGILVFVFLSGLGPAGILISSARRRRLHFGRFAWALVLLIVFWIVRIPVSGKCSTFYHFAVKY